MEDLIKKLNQAAEKVEQSTRESKQTFAQMVELAKVARNQQERIKVLEHNQMWIARICALLIGWNIADIIQRFL